MRPTPATAITIGVLLVSRLLAHGADPGAAVDPLASWIGWVEKAGTVGVCIWMLVWFQRRNDRQHDQLSAIAERSVTALERNHESNREFTEAVKGLADVVRQCSHHGK